MDFTMSSNIWALPNMASLTSQHGNRALVSCMATSAGKSGEMFSNEQKNSEANNNNNNHNHNHNHN